MSTTNPANPSGDERARARAALRAGLAIPGMPLALDAARRLDERRQRALTRYYAAAGAGGLAVGGHATQLAIRDPNVGLYEPILALTREELDRSDANRLVPLVRVAGVAGPTPQAVAEATLARDLGYHAALISPSASGDDGESPDALIDRCRAVAGVLPVVGFDRGPAAHGRPLPHAFWRRLAEVPGVAAIIVPPSDPYAAVDVVRAVVESERDDLALYAGDGANVVLDLITPYEFNVDGIQIERRITGALPASWAAWAKRAVELFHECRAATKAYAIPADLLRKNAQVADATAALLDAAGGFRGCIAGPHEVLRRQGLLEGVWLLGDRETLSPGQAAEIDRVSRAYPHLRDDAFVAEHLDEWMR